MGEYEIDLSDEILTTYDNGINDYRMDTVWCDGTNGYRKDTVWYVMVLMVIERIRYGI